MKHKLLFAFTMLSCFAFAQTTFAPKVTINTATGDGPANIASGLIDGDAWPDILIATQLGNTIEWYKNNGDGTFAAQPLIANGLNYINGLKLVDLNNDSFLDILAAAYSSNSIVWFQNDGSGNFSAANVISNSVSGASGIGLGDINNDTFMDIAITAYDADEVLWFSNNGTGTFTLEANKIDDTLDAPGSINLKDIDGDGDLDGLISTATYPGGSNVIEIFRNNLIQDGTVSFTKDPISVTTGKFYLFNATFEDLDGDANLDILATDISYGGGPAGKLYWFEDNGAGFTETEFTTSLNNPSVAQFRDLDNDGLNDIILSSGTSGSGNDIVWYKNNGAGGFDSEAVIDATQSQAYVFNIADFDTDGDLDIASCSYNQDALNYFENQKIVLSISDSELQNISIHPNPTKNQLYFEGFDGSIDVEVYDLLGKQVLNTTIDTDKSIDVSGLANGAYVVLINNKVNSRFIKE